MQEAQVRLFDDTYTNNPKAEQRTTTLAVFLLLVQLGLLAYLIFTKGFAYGFLGLYLLHLLVFSFLLARIWFDSHPEYRRHLTFTSQSVCYRTGFLKKEQDFDWDEVDEVRLSLDQVEFVLKNEAQHLVPLTMIHDATALHKANEQIRSMVLLKGIHLIEEQR
ncbi:hypothetical protein H7F15_17660 [Pontibacter sp. Tf4]|uniref:hypothetical protein n=1 Tax=Pontibacter sp. Tf4 TaxID=2761620 RepID=UPI0016293A42|nr:hypothetical protein [Pontibacter sp. Tf4]MBB6612873.1 hypothetical protein [Pontibacter sp. Tf4]